MRRLWWRRPLRCGYYGEGAVEIARAEDGTRHIRSSSAPDVVLAVPIGEWVALEEAIRNGQQF